MLTYPTQSMERSWREFAIATRSRFDSEPNSIDIHAERWESRRAMCGEHGRVVPTKQGLCPRCGGIVIDPPTPAEVVAMRRRSIARQEFAAFLASC
jgi:hypothetical protein